MDEDDAFNAALSEAVGRHLDHRGDYNDEVNSEDAYARANITGSLPIEHRLEMHTASNMPQQHLIAAEPHQIIPHHIRSKECFPEQYFSQSGQGRSAVRPDIRRVYQSSRNVSPPPLISQRQVQRYERHHDNRGVIYEPTYGLQRQPDYYSHGERLRRDAYMRHRSENEPTAQSYAVDTYRDVPDDKFLQNRPARSYSPERRHIEPSKAITPRLKSRPTQSRVVSHSENRHVPFEKLLQRHQRSQVNSRNIASAIKNRLDKATDEITSSEDISPNEAKMDIGGKSIPVKDIRKVLDDAVNSQRLRSPDQKHHALKPTEQLPPDDENLQSESTEVVQLATSPKRSPAKNIVNMETEENKSTDMMLSDQQTEPSNNKNDNVSMSPKAPEITSDAQQESTVQEEHHLSEIAASKGDLTTQHTESSPPMKDQSPTEEILEILIEEEEIELDPDQESDDEELLNLRLVALSTAYQRNADAVIGDKQAAHQDVTDKKQTKSKKKKVKQKKKSKEDDIKKSKSRSRSKEKIPPKSYSGAKSSETKGMSLRSSVVVVSKNTSSRRSREKSPKKKDYRDPSILTLGGEIMRKKSQQTKTSLQEIRNLNPDEGSKQFIKLKDKQTQSNKNTTNKELPNLGEPMLGGDNYEEVEMELECDDEIVERNVAHAIITKNNNIDPAHAEDSAQLIPPGTEPCMDHTPSQESIWDLLDSPLKPSTDRQNSEDLPPTDRPSMPDVAAIRETIKTKLQNSDPNDALPSPAESVDSGNEFQHAFDPPKLPFSMESNLVGEHSVSIDVEVVKSRNEDVKTVTSETTTKLEKDPEVKAEPAIQPTPFTNKRRSTEDADELREKLLLEILTKRANTRLAESTNPVSNHQPAPIQPQSIAAPLIPTVRPVALFPTPNRVPLLPLPPPVQPPPPLMSLRFPDPPAPPYPSPMPVIPTTSNMTLTEALHASDILLSNQPSTSTGAEIDFSPRPLTKAMRRKMRRAAKGPKSIQSQMRNATKRTNTLQRQIKNLLKKPDKWKRLRKLNIALQQSQLAERKANYALRLRALQAHPAVFAIREQRERIEALMEEVLPNSSGIPTGNQTQTPSVTKIKPRKKQKKSKGKGKKQNIVKPSKNILPKTEPHPIVSTSSDPAQSVGQTTVSSHLPVKVESKPCFPQADSSKPTTNRKSVFTRLGQRVLDKDTPTSHPDAVIDLTMMSDDEEANQPSTVEPKVEGLEDMLKRIRAKSAAVKEEGPTLSSESPFPTATHLTTKVATDVSTPPKEAEDVKTEPCNDEMPTFPVSSDVANSTDGLADNNKTLIDSRPSTDGKNVENVEDKLTRVNDLIKNDQTAILKLRAHKEARNEAIKVWKTEAAVLKKKLLSLETNIEKELNVIHQVDERLNKREGKMKQRQRLKHKFLNNLKPTDAKQSPVQQATTKDVEEKQQKSVPETVPTLNKPKPESTPSSSPAPSRVKRKRKSTSNDNVNKLAQKQKNVVAINSAEPARKNAKQSSAVPEVKASPKQPVVPKSVLTDATAKQTVSKQKTATGMRAKGSKQKVPLQALKRSSIQIQMLKNRLEEKARLLMRAKTLHKQNERLGIQLDLQKRLSPQKANSRSASPTNQQGKDAKTLTAVLSKPVTRSTVKTNSDSTHLKKAIIQDPTKLGKSAGSVKEVIVSLNPLVDQEVEKPVAQVAAVSTKPPSSPVNGGNKTTSELASEAPPLTPTLKKSRRMSKNSESDTERRRSSSSDLSKFTSTIVSDETKLAAASIVKSSFSAKRLAPYIIAEESSSAITRFFAAPECLAKWKINIAEIARQTVPTSYAEEEHRDESKLMPYQSHLRAFRSYRFSSFLRTQENLTIASTTFSNKIEPDRIVCRYGLHGQCLDAKCRAQHLDDMTLKPNELFLDLLSYCPSLLKKKDGKAVKSSDSHAIHLEAAETVVRNLCGATSMTLDEKCILLVSHINNTLPSKMPHTIRSQRRPLKYHQKSVEDLNKDEENEETDEEEQEIDLLNAHDLDIFSLDVGPRYFATAGDEQCSALERLHQTLEKNPDDVELRIKVARSYLIQTGMDSAASMDRRLDLALNILCLGIERAEQSEQLWCAYLPLLRHHHHGDLENKEEEEDIIDQVLLLLPYSKRVWREVMKWNWSYAKLDGLYHQLIHNLIHRYEATLNDESAEVPELTQTEDYYSSWLLCAIVERCHLAQLCSDRDQALATLANTLRELEELRQTKLSSLAVETNSVKSFQFPLTQQDSCRLHLTFIHVIEFGGLPDCFYDDSLSKLDYGLCATDQNVTLSFARVNRFNNNPNQLREFIKEALLSCDDPTKSPAENTVNCLPLYRALVDLEASLQRWDAVNITCERLVEMMQSDDAVSDLEHRHLTDVWCVWIDSILACGNAERITQTFDRAVTARPSSAKLAYTAAMYQLHCDSPDKEAALLYMETCLSTFYDLEGQNGLTAAQLFHKYKQLLKHDAPLISGDKKTKGNVDTESFQHEKAYLWLIYCLLTELSDGNSIDVYEAAIYNVATAEGRKAIWLHYLLHLRSTASSLEGAAETEVNALAGLEVMQQRMKWTRNMTAVVRRCLATIPCRRNVDSQPFTDYSFHNEVSDIFLSCFDGRQRGVALSILVESMPTNIPLLLRAAGDHLRKGDHASVIANLWRVTSSSKSRSGCYDVRIWKIAIGAYLAERKYKKAIRLCIRSLTIMPYCCRLWRDVSALLTLHGSKKDLQAVRVKCQKMLERDIRSFIDEELADLNTVFQQSSNRHEDDEDFSNHLQSPKA